MNNTLSKEYVFDKHLHVWTNSEGENFIASREVENYKLPDAIKLAMDEYAKQEAIEFSNFCSERYHGIRGDKGWMMVESPFTKYTDDEAYELYLLHKQNKEQ